MDGELKKMVIEAYLQPDYSGDAAEFSVMFNPTTYSQKYEVEYEDRQGPGDTGSSQVFGKVKPQEFNFEFLFDGTGTAPKPVKKEANGDAGSDNQEIDVQQKVEEFLTVTGKHDGEIHRPSYLKLSWGKLISHCVLKSAEVVYSLFRRDGKPLRAKVKATFAEQVTDKLRVAQERKSSPDLTHVHRVSAGEHLSQLAHRYYGDASRYFQVAQWNDLRSFRLDIGQQLEFPSIQEIEETG